VSLASAPPRTPRLLRDRTGVHRVTNIELFFDLVYVFAITQLSHYLLGHANLRGALQAGLLLLMVWLVWAYTTWVTNWLDPDQMAVRLLLVALMLASLALSVSLPRAFEDLGLWVGAAYAVQQIGRSVFMVIALRGHPLEANFQRILAWCRALPGIHPDRAGRVDRHHRRHPDREAGHRRQRGRLRGRVRRLGGAVVAVLRPERRGRGREDRPLETTPAGCLECTRRTDSYRLRPTPQ
jgi:Bacterial low temperature requirement A protein (LtrA)